MHSSPQKETRKVPFEEKQRRNWKSEHSASKLRLCWPQALSPSESSFNFHPGTEVRTWAFRLWEVGTDSSVKAGRLEDVLSGKGEKKTCAKKPFQRQKCPFCTGHKKFHWHQSPEPELHLCILPGAAGILKLGI